MAQTTAADPRSLLVSGGALTIGGVFTTIVAPSLVEALGTSGLANTQIGLHLTVLHAVQVFVIFGMATTGAVTRVSRGVVGVAGLVLCAAAFIGSSLLPDSRWLFAMQALIGLGAGLSYACGGSALSFAEYTERAYSLVTIGSIVVGASALALTPTMKAISADDGIYWGLAVAVLILAALGLGMPNLDHQSRDDDLTVAGSAQEQWLDKYGIALIAAYFLLNLGILAVWTFAGQMGESAGMTSAGSSWFLGAAQVLSVVGCLIAWGMGTHPSKVWVMLASLLILAVGKFLVGSGILWAFMLGMLTTNLTFYTVIPFVFAAGADLNPRSGRLVVIVGAAAMVAGAVAPLAGGVVAGNDGDWWTLGVAAGIVILASAPLMIFAVRAAYRRKYGAAATPVNV